MKTPYPDGRPADWPDSWRPTSAHEISAALIAEIRNALIPARHRAGDQQAAIDRVLDMADVCARKLQEIP